MREIHVDKLLFGRAGDAEYEAHFEDLMKRKKVGHAFICEALSSCANISVIFGLLDKDRPLFLEHQQRMIEWYHESYLRGEMKPLIGSFAAYIDSFARDFAGKQGRATPMPEDRERVMDLVLESLIATISRSRSNSLVPLNDVDPKRRKVLEDLDRLNGELPL